ncbi:aminotransferase class I/II-fold pyridoxal phosphate-dependent enzyme [Propioniciclava flava]
MVLFLGVAQAPPDAILGLVYRAVPKADTNPRKVNLGVGVYQDANGKLPLLRCVEAAEQRMVATPTAKGYQAIDGLPTYDTEVKELVFGAGSPLLATGRVITAQALGGTGALKLGADLFCARSLPDPKVLISNPSWENHQALFTRAGFTVEKYRYYDAQTKGVDVDGMIADLRAAAPGTIVVLHACCHNPTGYDLAPADWQRVIDGAVDGHLIIPRHRQGFAQGIEEDGAVVRAFAERVGSFLVSTSFSKSFSATGSGSALSVARRARRRGGPRPVATQDRRSAPTTRTGPWMVPPSWRRCWASDCVPSGSRNSVRCGIASSRCAPHWWRAWSLRVCRREYITDQVGMFSFSGLTKEQMQRLRSEYAVYGTDTGRICVAALNEGNIAYVSESIAAVLKD